MDDGNLEMVGYHGIAPCISRSQAERVRLLPRIRNENGPGGRSCTRTGSGLSGVPLLVGLRRGKIGGGNTPGRSCTCDLPIRNRLLWSTELRECSKKSRRLHGRKRPFRFILRHKEQTPLPPSKKSHPLVFQGGCFGVSGTPPIASYSRKRRSLWIIRKQNRSRRHSHRHDTPHC